MKIISFNVNGIRATVTKGLHETMADIDADVYCFQETKANEAQVAEALFGLGYHLYANSAVKAGYSGTAIVSKKEPMQVIKDMGIAEHDKEGRVIAAEFERFFIVNVYTPNSKNDLSRLEYRKTWDADFCAYVSKLQKEKPVIICGDLNVAHRPIDLARPEANYNKSAGYTQTEIDGLDNLIKAGFVDSFRYFYPDKVKYSWWSFRAGARARNVGWRIDYFMISESLVKQTKDAFILNGVMGSDHCPLGIELN
jgi:exodeoxyribonuclease-3